MAFVESKSKADIILEREQIITDVSRPLAVRKQAHKEMMTEVLNPAVNFDPATFDPMAGDPDYEIKKRNRVKPPDRLPTLGMLPKELLEGQMVGMFESKQDLYLIMAHYINQLLDRVDELEKGGRGNV